MAVQLVTHACNIYVWIFHE